MLRPTFVTTRLDVGVDLRDAQIAARNNLDRHPNYLLAAYMPSGT
jgi:hypothetical protein